MKYSELFSRTTKNLPKDEQSLNSKLLLQAGYIHKEMAGVYAYLPLGLRVFEKIKQIVREEMNLLGGQELVMTTLQPKDNWEITNRWDDKVVDIWFKTKLKNDNEVGLAWSHEEPITLMMKNFVSSYRDLPVYVYQFQKKMRNETRAKSGIMRTREFVMKDMYTYCRTEEEHQEIYDRTAEAYMKIFERVGLKDITYFTYASGGAFTQFSHEFQTICETGEDVIYVDKRKGIAVNKEVLTDELLSQLDINKDDLVEKNASEVGNIFSFGGKKCEELGLYFTDENGERKPVILGSYGIGIGRLMGVITEVFADEKGLVWPDAIAPYQVHLVSIGNDQTVIDQASEYYHELTDGGIEVLWDDRIEVSAGEKFADSDLIGIPVRVVVSKKTMQEGKVEVKRRDSEDAELVLFDEIV